LTASIQVVNNGTPSNTLYNYVGLSQPGIFNSISNLPAFQHSDYTMVTSSKPAQVGETVLVYLTGLGTVDGSGNSSSPFTASIGGIPATVLFAGTQSTVGGGYQLNVTVPSGVASGNQFLDISGPDAYNSSAVIPIGTGGAAAAIQHPAVRRAAPQNLSRSRRRNQAQSVTRQSWQTRTK
jgi:uncharacterized protein (TIGR03437 family)